MSENSPTPFLDVLDRVDGNQDGEIKHPELREELQQSEIIQEDIDAQIVALRKLPIEDVVSATQDMPNQKIILTQIYGEEIKDLAAQIQNESKEIVGADEEFTFAGILESPQYYNTEQAHQIVRRLQRILQMSGYTIPNEDMETGLYQDVTTGETGKATLSFQQFLNSIREEYQLEIGKLEEDGKFGKHTLEAALLFLDNVLTQLQQQKDIIEQRRQKEEQRRLEELRRQREAEEARKVELRNTFATLWTKYEDAVKRLDYEKERLGSGEITFDYQTLIERDTFLPNNGETIEELENGVGELESVLQNTEEAITQAQEKYETEVSVLSNALGRRVVVRAGLRQKKFSVYEKDRKFYILYFPKKGEQHLSDIQVPPSVPSQSSLSEEEKLQTRGYLSDVEIPAKNIPEVRLGMSEQEQEEFVTTMKKLLEDMIEGYGKKQRELRKKIMNSAQETEEEKVSAPPAQEKKETPKVTDDNTEEASEDNEKEELGNEVQLITSGLTPEGNTRVDIVCATPLPPKRVVYRDENGNLAIELSGVSVQSDLEPQLAENILFQDLQMENIGTTEKPVLRMTFIVEGDFDYNIDLDKSVLKIEIESLDLAEPEAPAELEASEDEEEEELKNEVQLIRSELTLEGNTRVDIVCETPSVWTSYIDNGDLVLELPSVNMEIEQIPDFTEDLLVQNMRIEKGGTSSSPVLRLIFQVEGDFEHSITPDNNVLRVEIGSRPSAEPEGLAQSNYSAEQEAPVEVETPTPSINNFRFEFPTNNGQTNINERVTVRWEIANYSPQNHEVQLEIRKPDGSWQSLDPNNPTSYTTNSTIATLVERGYFPNGTALFRVGIKGNQGDALEQQVSLPPDVQQQIEAARATQQEAEEEAQERSEAIEKIVKVFNEENIETYGVRVTVRHKEELKFRVFPAEGSKQRQGVEVQISNLNTADLNVSFEELKTKVANLTREQLGLEVEQEEEEQTQASPEDIAAAVGSLEIGNYSLVAKVSSDGQNFNIMYEENVVYQIPVNEVSSATDLKSKATSSMATLKIAQRIMEGDYL